MNTMNSHIHCSSFTVFTNLGFYFLLRLLNHFLDSGRMNSAIYDQLL